ncbi:hypothetical protein V7S57_08775 [Caulobacter sp. CCNWLY153]|uniref:hypothetical protein n=1 Tax=unclassified Caulobacter TaxID=2648921 RepID=UPI002FF41CA8
MAREHDEDHCPLAAVDRRLGDLHRLWHQAADAYFDPDAFRVAIQGAIQTMRSVTFILQKNKAQIPDFDRWYGDWQKKMGADPLMVWMRDARNSIEKEGDLEAHSFVRAEIVASYLENGPRIDVPAKLSDAPLKLVKSIPVGALGDHIRKDGIVRIQRRWVENTLPEYELLDAVAIAYGKLSLLVDAAHEQLGLSKPRPTNVETGQAFHEGDRGGRLPCMIGHADSRTLDIWLATGAPVEFETIERRLDLSEALKLEARYGVKPAGVFGVDNAPEERLRSLFATARKMFEKDGHHIMIAFLLRQGKPVDIRELRPGEHGHKYLMMRSLAHEVVIHGADAVIMISESWSAPYNPAKPMRRAADAPDKIELLTGTLVTKVGEPLYLVAQIRRDGRAVKLDTTVERQGGSHYLFAPVYEVWGKPVPKEWIEHPERDGARER